MSEPRSLSRRTALAGLGAGSLGFFASHIGGTTAGVKHSTLLTANHPLTGHWLAQVALLSNPEVIVSVPAIFGADGSVVMIYPCVEANEDGVQVKGAAVGTWEPVDDRSARFTTVQVLSGINGEYQGTVTFDGHPLVSDDDQSFTVNSNVDLLTMRDSLNVIVSSVPGSSSHPMRAMRMAPGRVRFPDSTTTSTSIPEVGPVHPGDPRLDVEDEANIPEVAPTQPNDPRVAE